MNKMFDQLESNFQKVDQESLDKTRWKNGDFSDVEKVEIEKQRKLLSTLAHFIGKDFKMPVEINVPGEGWHWDFAKNVVRIDPIDLLEKPLDYLRFVISHEGGHRRISRTEFIPTEVWQRPGFAFMMNAIEDPRDNNFVAENYPKFKDQMQLAYNFDLDLEVHTKENAQAKLGYQPRHIQAGFEYIKQWFGETQGQEMEISPDLPEEVRDVIGKTLQPARDSWWRYPSKAEADKSENLIKQYAQKSYEINLHKIWPEYQKLVDADLVDQRMQEFMKDMQTEKASAQKSDENGQGSSAQELNDKLNEAEQNELAAAIEKALDQAQNENNGEPKSGQPIDLDTLSEELKQKIKAHLESLPEDQKQKLTEQAKQELKDFDQKISEALAGKTSDDPDKREARKKDGLDDSIMPIEKTDKDSGTKDEKQPDQPVPTAEQTELKAAAEKVRDQIEKSLNKDSNTYETKRREVLAVINKLEADLREIFVQRQTNKWQSGFRVGKKIDLAKRMQEKAKGLSAVESKAWQKREAPTEKDYAITLLIDLSGSMDGNKIEEAFKSTIVLAEVLNRLSIKTEILGFNDRLYEYQNYGQAISKAMRENMGGMLAEVDSDGARYNDDGWALEKASERLARQNVNEKILIVLSDGQPEPSSAHSGGDYNLNRVVKNISQNTDQKLIGLGILSDAVASYYPDNLPNIKAEDLGKELAKKIKAVIEAR